MLKIKILEKFVTKVVRVFKAETYPGQVGRFAQYHSGGEDYNPHEDVEAMVHFIDGSPSNGIVMGYKDNIPRKSSSGEKRLYAIDSEGSVCAELYLKNDGKLKIETSSDVDIESKTGKVNVVCQGECNVKASTVKIDAAKTEIGVNGKSIARVGDEVEVDPQTHKGVIKSGGINTSV